MMAAITEMLSDKSVLTAITAVLVAIGAKFGLQLDDATTASFVGVFALAILKHAAEAHGATAAQTHADAIAPQVATRTPQAGFARFDVMFTLAALAGAAFAWVVVLHLTGCATLKTMTGDFAVCAKADLGQLVKNEEGQLVSLATAVAELIEGNPAALEADALALAGQVGTDAVDCAKVAYEDTHPTSAGSGSAVSVIAPKPGLSRLDAWIAAQRKAGK